MEERVMRRIFFEAGVRVEGMTMAENSFIPSGEEVALGTVTISSGKTLRNDGVLVVGKLTTNGRLINNGRLEIQEEFK